MQIPRPSDADKDAFEVVIGEIAGANVKAMFGNLGAFVNGNMFAGLFGSDLGVRLTEAADRNRLAAVPGTGPYGPAERPMGGWTSLPSDWMEQPDATAMWVGLAFEQVAEMPPKVPKPRKS
jgi:TfoX/Sxy family transcriptional regulator of competence genes